ncbi:MAG: PAS domain S-box protein [Candidatus Glassbacteria bacterium]|nr:PAS domain S-box protein [Candidatus Glassbacteria bacterium]
MNSGQNESGTRALSTVLDNCMSCALENVACGILAVDSEGAVVLFNRAAENLTGYDRQDVVGRPYGELPFLVEDTGAGALFERISAGPSEEREEKKLSTGDGRGIPVESLIRPVRNDDGELVGALEIFTDLSAIKELREEVSRSRTLSALGEMSANVAHEIRNPLGSIGGFAALLERDLEDDDPRRNLVKKIIEGVASLDKIATNLLIFTRPIKADLRQTDLGQYVNEVLAYLEMEIESRTLPVRIQRNFPSGPLNSKIDPSLMQQVLLNIFQNGLHAMRDKGGCLTVRLAKRRNGGRERVESLPEEMIELLIEDEGVGMSEEVRQKIFNPFFTTREDGTGLGLAISKKMIQEQNGVIRVDSQPDSGTKITILLPYCP